MKDDDFAIIAIPLRNHYMDHPTKIWYEISVNKCYVDGDGTGKIDLSGCYQHRDSILVDSEGKIPTPIEIGFLLRVCHETLSLDQSYVDHFNKNVEIQNNLGGNSDE
jgi:hypothetical protein